MSTSSQETREEARFREIFRKMHAKHPPCLLDEWIMEPCRDARGRPVDRPIVWSRRNGPWRRCQIIWVGAAPGNAGGKGKGMLGAHGTRIPFGGDIAGANLEALFGSIGLTRNETFITATLNTLPAAGGGEPTPAEINARVGSYRSNLHSLRDVLIATGPALIIALGNVGLRALLAAGQTRRDPAPLPSLHRIQSAGFARNTWQRWPEHLAPDDGFLAQWHGAWGADAQLPVLAWLTHPSGQNMSPYAGVHTVFHTRMLEARDTLRAAVQDVLKWPVPAQRPEIPDDGIYALPEWQNLILPKFRAMDSLWREKGV